MDDIRRGDGWDFNNDEVSVFTYWALFGTGATICFISIILQFTIPLVLLMNTLREKLYNINDENDPFVRFKIVIVYPIAPICFTHCFYFLLVFYVIIPG